MTAIDTDDLTKRYGSTLAVDDLSLSVPEGTVYGFLGPNGAGKTTTMRLLTGLTPPTGGRAAIAGVPIGDRDELRPHIGYLPEEPPLYEEATADEQLEYAAGLRDLPPAAARERIDRHLAALELADDAGTRIGEYSKGMRQKVAYSQAVLHEPDVVFLDEPTSGLDPRAARTLRGMITDLADGGTTVFLSTHILSVVEEVADTVGILYEGRLVAEDAPDALAHHADASETDETKGTSEGGSLEDAFLELTTDDPGDRETTDG